MLLIPCLLFLIYFLCFSGVCVLNGQKADFYILYHVRCLALLLPIELSQREELAGGQEGKRKEVEYFSITLAICESCQLQFLENFSNSFLPLVPLSLCGRNSFYYRQSLDSSLSLMIFLNLYSFL